MTAKLHDTIGPSSRRSRGAWVSAVLLAAMGMVFAACHLLDVSNPDIVPPEGLNGTAALPTIRAGAIGDLHIAYTGSGAQGSGGTTEGVILLGGMLADELINTETFPDRILADARRPQRESVTLTNVFRNVHRARRAAEVAAGKFRTYSPDTTLDAGLAEMLSLAGYAYAFLAENYCSGVAVSTVNANGSFTYGDPLTSAQVLDTALNRNNSRPCSRLKSVPTVSLPLSPSSPMSRSTVVTESRHGGCILAPAARSMSPRFRCPTFLRR